MRLAKHAHPGPPEARHVLPVIRPRAQAHAGVVKQRVVDQAGKIDDGELDKSSNLQKAQIAGSTKPVTFYSMDAVISVGYRVNSKAATKFRQWGTGTSLQVAEAGERLLMFPVSTGKVGAGGFALSLLAASLTGCSPRRLKEGGKRSLLDD